MKYDKTPPRMKVGDVDFQCPNCCRELHRTIWQEREIDMDGKLSAIGLVHADALCSCGAQILVADDLERFGLYWLNEQKMKQHYSPKKEEGEKP